MKKFPTTEELREQAEKVMAENWYFVNPTNRWDCIVLIPQASGGYLLVNHETKDDGSVVVLAGTPILSCKHTDGGEHAYDEIIVKFTEVFLARWISDGNAVSLITIYHDIDEAPELVEWKEWCSGVEEAL